MIGKAYHKDLKDVLANILRSLYFFSKRKALSKRRSEEI